MDEAGRQVWSESERLADPLLSSTSVAARAELLNVYLAAKRFLNSENTFRQEHPDHEWEHEYARVCLLAAIKQADEALSRDE